MITVDLEPPFDRRRATCESLAVLHFEWLRLRTISFWMRMAWFVHCRERRAAHSPGRGRPFPAGGVEPLATYNCRNSWIPLLEMNEIHGTTALWPGSHRDETRASTESGDEPLVREGSCVLWDYRLRHCGTPNRSAMPRPLLYMTYCRPWFMDHKNYRKQIPLRARGGFLADLTDDLRHLLVRVQTAHI